MVEALAMIALVAVVGAFCVPLLVVLLSHMHLFAPVSVRVFGSEWRFGERANKGVTPQANTSTLGGVSGPSATSIVVVRVFADSDEIEGSFFAPQSTNQTSANSQVIERALAA